MLQYIILQETLSFSIENQLNRIKKYWLGKLQPSLNMKKHTRTKNEWTVETRSNIHARAKEVTELNEALQRFWSNKLLLWYQQSFSIKPKWSIWLLLIPCTLSWVCPEDEHLSYKKSDVLHIPWETEIEKESKA